jgi:thiol-disulfide isomerase/thioredoxin
MLLHRRRRVRTIAVLGAGAVVVVAVLLLAVANTNSSGGSGRTTATRFDLPSLNGGGRVRLADFGGRPTVVNFFASWCTACDSELPEFKQTGEALRGKINFVFVNSNETGDWHDMASRHQITDFPIAKDIGGSQGNGLYQAVGGSGGMPITAFYDANGKLITASYGALTGGALPRELQQLYRLSPA